MQRLPNCHLERKAELIATANSAAIALQQEVTRHAQGLTSDEQDFLRARDAYNVVVDDINSFIQAVSSEQEAYFDDRTERWQESEPGQAFQAWQSEWDIEVDTCDLDADELVESGDLDASECLANLPDEP